MIRGIRGRVIAPSLLVVSASSSVNLALFARRVSYTCWQSNPNINAWMKANGIATYQDLEGYYVQKVRVRESQHWLFWST